MAQINKPDTYFNTKLYTGTGASNSITGVGFQPDFTWIKDRDGIRRHYLFDSVRGVYKELNSDDAQAEETKTNSLTAFGSDGFTVADLGDVNFSGDNFVSWNWLASNTTASNTDGSITSTVSANTTSGFSIVSYTGNGTAGATVGHGLGVTPKFMIIKNRDSGSENFCSYHVSLGATKTQKFTTSSAQTLSSMWNNTEPTSSVFTIGNDGAVNVSGNKQIVYCFAEKKGFSKFGSYTGNGSTDGTFIYTGFKPAFVLVKASSTAGTWHLQDNARNPSNIVNKSIYPNSSSAEETYDVMDFTSNGFKIRTTNTGINNDGVSYIYMAFAESPLVGTNNIPATAR